MIRTDEDALICDFAETYGVLDYHTIPIRTAATLAAGLRHDARIVQQIAGVDFDRWLMTGIYDGIRILAWQNTKDAQKGKNKPELVQNRFLRGKEKPDQAEEVETFESGDAFRQAWKRITECR